MVKVEKSDAEWRKLLTPEQYEVMRGKGTERPFTGKYWNSDQPGTYLCAACGQELFKSAAKFGSSCGWPAFSEAAALGRVTYHEDHSLGMVRTEVLCSACGGHLGHVFDDGPGPTHVRFCINSVCLRFVPAPKPPKP